MEPTDYARAEQMLRPYRSRRTPSVVPQWCDDGERFRYSVGSRHVVVDPGKGERWTEDAPAAEETPDPPTGIRSPDGRRVAFRRDGDLWVREGGEDGADDVRLTDDAEPGLVYGGVVAPMSMSLMLRSMGVPGELLHATWSPDSRRLLVHRLDERGLPEQVLVESAPAGGGRPVEHRMPFPVPYVDGHPTITWHVVDVETRTRVDVDDPPVPMVHGTAIVHSWWSDAGDTVHLLQQSRDARTLRLRRIDPDTGAITTPVTETGTTRVDITPVLGGPRMVRVLGSGEILWWSQRDGWGHLWLYPAGGGPATQVTSGEFVVRDVLGLDEDRRCVWFLAGGLADDPYARQICRIGLDGTGFVRLTDDDLDHDAVAPPQGGYVVDRASSPSVPPRARVLDPDGEVLVELEAPDTDALRAAGWTPPERFAATAADGHTTVYGLLWRPHGFDPRRRYPVVDHVYGGPQTPAGGAGFDSSHAGEPEALAALGFAVVVIDGRGTAGRSKAFGDHSYGDLGSAGALDDHAAAIRELGRSRPWLDTDRVGIIGHSAGGYAAARALFAYPEFFSVGVAISGNHDDTIGLQMWAEHYHGDADLSGVPNTGLAANLRGKLLLVHGELDQIVPVAHTLRLVDALVEADLDADLLIVPGADHAIVHRRHHVFRRTWDHLVRHLHGTEPPPYRLDPLPLPGIGG